MSSNQDVIVVGGGVIGVCVAYYLRKSGRSVTLLERDHICSGSSYGNGGLILPSHSMPLSVPGAILKGLTFMLDPSSPFYIKPRLSIDLFLWMLRFMSASNYQSMRSTMSVITNMASFSRTLYEEIISEESLDFGFERRGQINLASTPKGYEEILLEAELLAEEGLSYDILEGEDVVIKEPSIIPGMPGGIFFHDDSHLVPNQFVEKLASRFVELGGIIETNVEILGFDIDNHRVIAARSPQDLYKANDFVLAAGSWTSNFSRNLNVSVPIQPAKGYSITIDMPENGPHIPIMLADAKVGVTPMGSKLRFAGTLELSGFDSNISMKRVQGIINGVREHLNIDFSLDDAEIWYGMRPLSPDGLPILGRFDQVTNLILASGHSTLGMTLGPATGQLVSELIGCDQTTIDPKPFSPMRFK